MKRVAAALGTALFLAVIGGSVERVLAGSAVIGPCCVCTLCDFSEQCFTGLTASDSARCTDLCGAASCRAGEIRDQACETYTPLMCEVITPAPAAAHAAPAMRPLALVLAVLGTAFVGGLRLVRRRTSKTGPA